MNAGKQLAHGYTWYDYIISLQFTDRSTRGMFVKRFMDTTIPIIHHTKTVRSLESLFDMGDVCSDVTVNISGEFEAWGNNR